MMEQFFVPPANAVIKWFHRFVGKAYPLLPREMQRQIFERLLNGPAGVRWAENYASMPPFDPSGHRKWEVVARALETVESIHWIGCCSGREVAYFAERYPQKRVIASDLSASIVRWCRQRYRLPNVCFQQVDATRFDFGEDLVVAMGVLTYMDATQITQFSGNVRRLVSAEPVTRGYQGRWRSYRGRMTWNHPYRRLFPCTYYEEIPTGHSVTVVFTVGIQV